MSAILCSSDKLATIPEVKLPATLPSAPAFVPASGLAGALVTLGSVGSLGAGRAGLPAVPAAAVLVPEFSNAEDAERAFMGLLRSKGVTPSWTWEQTMREIVTDPMYKAIKSMGDRRMLFERYVDEVRRREKESRERNLDRIRPAWREGLGRASEGEGGMKSWWGWEKSRRELATRLPEMWRMARDDDERRILWEEYVGELKKQEDARERDTRHRNLEKIDALFKSLNLELGTPWQSARRAVLRSSDWTGDAELQQIHMLDMLTSFETSVKFVEREANDVRQRQKEERRRRQRKTREAFVVRTGASGLSLVFPPR